MIRCIDMAKPRVALVFSSIVLSSTLLLSPKVSVAGVIVETEYPGPDGYRLIEIIQGHTEKVATVYTPDRKDPLTLVKGSSVWDVYDLDKGTDTEIDYADKSYDVRPYPGSDNPSPNGPENFKPTGKRRKAAGYWCYEYGASMGSARFYGNWTDFECVSNDPPGATEYNQFEKLQKSLLVKAGFDSPGYEPDGFVLDSRSEGDDGDSEGPRIILIESKPILPAEFEPPAGFVKEKSP
jgi:hypothetical protein